MANILNKIQTAINTFKTDEADALEITNSDEKMIKEMCYVGDIQKLKEQKTKLILPVGLMISKHVRIGKNCVIYQNVTIGGKDFPNRTTNPESYPEIGDNVVIYPGAFIVGPIKIGNNCVIGANTVVVGNVPDNSMVAGNPAKIMPRN